MRWGFLVLLVGCATSSPYERLVLKREGMVTREAQLPFAPGTSFVVRQGAFGEESHREAGNEYSWDLEVPLGTQVLSVDNGKVLEIYAPEPETGGCDAQFSDRAWNVKIEHADRTVAQYVHVRPAVRVGDAVKAGEVIARTAPNGWFCYPHLHFGIYRSRYHLYSSGERETIPVLFRGVPQGVLREGLHYRVPNH